MISPVYAAGGQNMSSLLTLLPFILIFAVMYFFMIRPQKKRADAHKAMLEELKKGDKIVTIGGIIARIEKINGNEVILEIESGNSLTLLKESISYRYTANTEPKEAVDKEPKTQQKAAVRKRKGQG